MDAAIEAADEALLANDDAAEDATELAAADADDAADEDMKLVEDVEDPEDEMNEPEDDALEADIITPPALDMPEMVVDAEHEQGV